MNRSRANDHRLGHRPTSARHVIRSVLVCGLTVASTGCHDGPLYALKAANPFYSMHQWRKDEALGKTAYTRRAELSSLARSIASMPPEQQRQTQTEIKRILAEEESVEMRRLAVIAGGRLTDPVASLGILESGLGDAETKVRMEACRSLGQRGGAEAARLLASAVGTDTDIDVRHSALAALGSTPGEVATDVLRRTLEDRNPATRLTAISSLKRVTGQDLGNDPSVWIASLDNRSRGVNSDPLPAATVGFGAADGPVIRVSATDQ